MTNADCHHMRYWIYEVTPDGARWRLTPADWCRIACPLQRTCAEFLFLRASADFNLTRIIGVPHDLPGDSGKDL